MKKHSKRYKEIKKNEVEVDFETAISYVQENATCKFDESIDIAFNLNLLKKHSIRETVSFKHGFGKTKKILAFVKEERKQEALDSGADYAGNSDLIEKINGGWIDFDVAIATPDMMREVAKVARILGTKGLMPNPKAKTVTDDLVTSISAVKAGRKEFRASSDGIINFSVGKKSMPKEHILENIKSLYEVINSKKPLDLKGDYIKTISLSSSMGKGIRISQRGF